MLSGNKPLHESMMTLNYGTIWRHEATINLNVQGCLELSVGILFATSTISFHVLPYS